MSILQQHFQEFAKEELERKAIINSLMGNTITSELKRKEIMHALLDEDKKLMEVNISKAIDAQFEPEDVQEMYNCGMTISEVVNYMTEKHKELLKVKESLEIAEYNLQVNINELDEITRNKCMEVIRKIDENFGGNYNDQT